MSFINSNKDRLAYALIGVVAFCVFANTLGHGFVYDDNRQILMNPLIQRSELYGKALTSDVWGFKGTDTIAASNYFRPTFVAWLISNWSLFGASPWGWHFLAVLLHAGVCILLFAFLRRLGCELVVATAISVLFAVHPVHVESVAWISGATDTLLGLFLFLSLILADVYAADGRPGRRRTLVMVLSIAAFLLAAGAKEVAVFCVPLYWLIFRRGGEQKSASSALVATAPFVVAAIGFFAIRYLVLGALFLPVEDPVSPSSVLITIPKLFAFYLKQMFWPAALGPALPIRPVTAFDFAHVVLPAFVSLTAVAGLVYLARRSFIQMFGLALFGLTMLPVLRISNFPVEQIAHDRYLYLPVAGMLMTIVPALAGLFGETKTGARRKVFATSAGVVSLVLALLTVSYNGAWRTSEALWRHAVTIDADSAHAWSHLAASTAKPQESLNAYERSMQLRRSPAAIVGKARALVSLRDNEGAVASAREAIAIDPSFVNAYTLFQAYEVETFALAALARYAEAESSLRSARLRLPIYYAALTEKLSVTLYSQNRKQDALIELESARQRARTENLVESKSVLLRLGMLYAEFGNRDAARTALREYLDLTEGLGATPASDRKQAYELLGRL